MGTMCAKNPEDLDPIERPLYNRSSNMEQLSAKKKKQQDQMKQPLVQSDGNNTRDIDKSTNELIPPMAPDDDEQPIKERSPSPSSQLYEADKQMISEDIQQKIHSDDNSEDHTNGDQKQPEYSKTDNKPSTPSIDNDHNDHNDDTQIAVNNSDEQQHHEPEPDTVTVPDVVNDVDDEREEEKTVEPPQDIKPAEPVSNDIVTLPTDDVDDEREEEKSPEIVNDIATDTDEQKMDDTPKMDAKYALPATLSETPMESMVTMDDSDKDIAKQIEQKYADKLSKYPLEKMKFVERYTVGYRHIKKKKRFQEMCKDIDYFFEMHEKYDYDNIIKTESTAEELDAWKQFMYGQDAQGHPVMYDLIGSSDCKLMKKVFLDKSKPFGQAAHQHVFRFMRKVENHKIQSSLLYGTKIYKQIQVLDMKGFTSDHLKGKNRKLTKMVIESLTRSFPEGTYKMYIINAPWPFRALWGAVKAFMDPITVKKTKVLGEDFLKELVKDVPIEMIPPCYGGKGVWEIQYGSVPKNYSIDVYHGLD